MYGMDQFRPTFTGKMIERDTLIVTRVCSSPIFQVVPMLPGSIPSELFCPAERGATNGQSKEIAADTHVLNYSSPVKCGAWCKNNVSSKF